MESMDSQEKKFTFPLSCNKGKFGGPQGQRPHRVKKKEKKNVRHCRRYSGSGGPELQVRALGPGLVLYPDEGRHGWTDCTGSSPPRPELAYSKAET